MDAAFALALLLFSFTAIPSSANWCVCKDGSDAVLQKTLDYACGAGADYNPLHQNAPCFQPNTVRAHCSYAVNSYFQKKGQAPGTCDFAGTTTPVASDPSVSGCVFPSSANGAGTSTTTFHHHHLHPLSNKKCTAYNPSLPVPPFPPSITNRNHHPLFNCSAYRPPSSSIFTVAH